MPIDASPSGTLDVENATLRSRNIVALTNMVAGNDAVRSSGAPTLEVYGDPSNGGNETRLELVSNLSVENSKSFTRLTSNAGVLDIKTGTDAATNGTITFGGFSNERMRIATNGNVGIGTNDPNQGNLTVYALGADPYFSGYVEGAYADATDFTGLAHFKSLGTHGVIRISNNADSQGTTRIDFNTRLSGYWGINTPSNSYFRGTAPAAGRIMVTGETGDSYEDAYMTFHTCRDLRVDGGGGTGNLYERMRITSEGKVGISNPNPYHTLDVSGNFRATEWIGLGGGANARPIQITKTATIVNSYPYVDFFFTNLAGGWNPFIVEVLGYAINVSGTTVETLRRYTAVYGIEANSGINYLAGPITRIDDTNISVVYTVSTRRVRCQLNDLRSYSGIYATVTSFAGVI